MLRSVVALLFAAVSAFAQFDPAVFKSPPAQYRGHAMWSFPLSTLNENYIVSGIREMAKLNYGGFFHRGGRRADHGAIGSVSEAVPPAAE